MPQPLDSGLRRNDDLQIPTPVSPQGEGALLQLDDWSAVHHLLTDCDQNGLDYA